MLVYQLLVCDPVTGKDISPLMEARNVRFNVELHDPSSVQFEVPTAALESSILRPLLTDVKLMFGNTVVFRGRLINPRRTFGHDASTLTFSAFSYKEILRRRYLTDDYVVPVEKAPVGEEEDTRKDIVTHASALVDIVQSRPGGDLGIITDQVLPTGYFNLAERVIPAGTSVFSAINELFSTSTDMSYDQSVEWDITPIGDRLVLEIFSSAQGYGRGRTEAVYTAQIGSSVLNGTEVIDTSKFANVITVLGAKSTLASVGGQVKTTQVSANVSTSIDNSPYGRWESAVTDGSLLDTTAVNERANYLLSVFSNLMPTYNLQIEPGHWSSPNDLWIGDYIILDLHQDGWEVRRSDLRTTSMNFGLGTDGEYSLDITVEYPLPADTTLTSLESRVRIAEGIWQAYTREIARLEALADADKNRTAKEIANIEAAQKRREAFEADFPHYRFGSIS